MSLTLIRKLERKEFLSFIFFKEYLSVNRSLTRKWAKQDALKFNDQEPDVFNQQFNFLQVVMKKFVKRSFSYLH